MSLRASFAIGSFVVSAVLTAIGSFSGNDNHEWRQWLIVLAISAVATAVVFWLIVPRIENVARGALILAVIGAVAIVAFWLGIPVVFAGAAALLVLDARQRGMTSTALSVAAVLAALTTIAAVVLAFVG
jgi:predicted phage tail protein